MAFGNIHPHPTPLPIKGEGDGYVKMIRGGYYETTKNSTFCTR